MAQKDTLGDNTLDTERLIIVKPYTPSVSDAFKVKQNPVVNDSIERSKKEVSYDIFSFPVASTFTPAKGRAANVEKKSAPHNYDNYAALGFGNYSNVIAEFYGNLPIDRDKNLGIALTHNSSQGGIDDVKLDDKYYDTDLGLDYTADARDFTWGANAGFQHQVYNWYGIPDFRSYDESEYAAIDPQQTYYTAKAGANIDVNEGIFNKASLQYRRFWDKYSSGENHVLIDPEFRFGAEKNIGVKFTADYVNGKFDQASYNKETKYSFLNLGIHPSIQITNNDLSVDIGVQAVYSMDGENDENKFYIYPKVKGSYRVAEDYLIAYAGADGGLKQNTYYDFVQENPFLSPTLTIAPTDQQYRGFVGAKGKFTEQIGYDIRGSYASEINKPLFRHNIGVALSPTITKGYQNFNAFGIVYDDVKTLRFFGELKASVSQKLSLTLNAAYNNYSTKNQTEAWNLPEFEGSLNANYQITDKWFAGASVFFVGDRKDLFDYDFLPVADQRITKTVILDGHVDANLRLGYKVTDQLSFFVRGNNLIGRNYEKWFGYPVQGAQFMGGASYQFDW